MNKRIISDNAVELDVKKEIKTLCVSHLGTKFSLATFNTPLKFDSRNTPQQTATGFLGKNSNVNVKRNLIVGL